MAENLPIFDVTEVALTEVGERLKSLPDPAKYPTEVFGRYARHTALIEDVDTQFILFGPNREFYLIGAAVTMDLVLTQLKQEMVTILFDQRSPIVERNFQEFATNERWREPNEKSLAETLHLLQDIGSPETDVSWLREKLEPNGHESRLMDYLDGNGWAIGDEFGLEAEDAYMNGVWTILSTVYPRIEALQLERRFPS